LPPYARSHNSKEEGATSGLNSTTSRDHPAWYFIKWAILSSDDPAKSNVDATLKLYGLAPCSVDCYQSATEELGLPPEDFYYGSSTHRPTVRYLKDQRIYSMCVPDDVAVEMRDKVLADPTLRTKVDSLLLGRVSPKEISFRLKKHNHVSISAEALEEYCHYFWNVNRLSMTDWVDYFDSDYEGRTGSPAVQNLMKTSLLSGPAVALYRVGIPRAVNSQQVLEELRDELYHTFLEVKQLPVSMQKVLMLKDLTGSLSRIDERMQAGDTALQDILRSFDLFKVVPKEQRVPNLADLAPT
jgi:hypothetical protein